MDCASSPLSLGVSEDGFDLSESAGRDRVGEASQGEDEVYPFASFCFRYRILDIEFADYVIAGTFKNAVKIMDWILKRKSKDAKQELPTNFKKWHEIKVCVFCTWAHRRFVTHSLRIALRAGSATNEKINSPNCQFHASSCISMFQVTFRSIRCRYF